MKKSILRLGALALMSWMSIGAFAINTVDEIFTSPTDGNKYRITKVYENNTPGEVELVYWQPIGGRTEVGDEVIKDSYENRFKCTSIQGKTATTDAAFKGTSPASITIGESVTKIGANAFSDLNGDVTITFDLNASKLAEIGANAFSPATANTVTVTNTLLELATAANDAKLGAAAFAKVTFAANTEVRLGNIQAVPAQLFMNSTNLTYVLFGALNKLTAINESAFEGCSSIQWFGYFDTVLDAHFLPYTLTTIGKKAFKGALHYDATNKLPEFKFSVSFKNLSLADVPFAEITSVGESAFEGCTWLDNVYFCNLFPATLVSAESVKVLAGGQRTNAAFTYGNAAFASSILKGKYDFTARTDETFNNAFKGNTQIIEAILPTSTKTIGFEAFQGCTTLKLCDLTKLPVLATIEYDAFMNTNAYVNVWIPNTVTFIGKDAFSRGVTEPVSPATNRTYDESSCAPRTIAILSKESTVANDVSKVIKSYVKCSTNPNRYHATQPIVDYTNTTLVVPMGLMKAYATAKFPSTVHPSNCSSSDNCYDWSLAAGDGTATNSKLYTYDTNAKNADDKIYVGYYEYTVTTPWSNQYTTGCSEYPLVKLTKINNSNSWTTNTYTSTLWINSGSDKTKDFTFQLPQTVCAENEWDNGAGSVTKAGSENTHTGFLDLYYSENNANGVNFVFYWVVATEKMSAIGTNSTYPNAIKNHVTNAEVQANKIDLTDVFNECTNLASFDFQGYPNLVNANNVGDNTPKNAVTGWYGAIAAPTEATMGVDAFNGCSSLAKFNGVTPDFIYTGANVGNNAFLNCGKITTTIDGQDVRTVIIPNNVTVIGTSAYDGTKIKEVTLPLGLVTLNDKAFANDSLTKIILPKEIRTIGSQVFDGKAVNEYYNDDPSTGIVVDGHLEGVLDIYAYWENKDIIEGLSIASDAFGNAVYVSEGNEPKYIVRRLYIPDGTTGVAPTRKPDGTVLDATGATFYNKKDPFNDIRKFTFEEGIIARTKAAGAASRENDLYGTGRLDITINQKTGLRTLTIDDENDINLFKISKTTAGVQVVYNRNVKKGVFNPLFVPFSVKGKGDDYQIYKIYDTKVVDENGTPKVSIEYVKLKDNETTKPNVPYVIVTASDKVTLTSVAYSGNTYNNTTEVFDYSATPITPKTYTHNTSGARVVCSTAEDEYQFFGTVATKTGDNTFYALTEGNYFAKVPAIAKINALRFYMTTRNKIYADERFYIKALDLDEVTAIENVKANSLNAPMFDLMGRQITAPAKGQVYIQNGVKKLAK